jgi:hypothetical protein
MYKSRWFIKWREYTVIRSGANNAVSNKLQRDVDITHRENTGRKNTKANNEIRAKMIRIQWPHGNVRPEPTKANPWRRRRRNNNIVP